MESEQLIGSLPEASTCGKGIRRSLGGGLMGWSYSNCIIGKVNCCLQWIAN